jgi:hypothetical protein
MVEQVKTFMGADWKSLSQTFDDFNEAKQAALRKVMKQCATDFEYPLAEKDTEHENFKNFALCLRSNVAISPSLNGSKAVRSSILGWTY